MRSPLPLLVHVEFGRGRTLYTLSEGLFERGDPGVPASPNTGALVRVDGDGGFTLIEDGLNQPTSFEIIGSNAHVVTLSGQVWVFETGDD